MDNYDIIIMNETGLNDHYPSSALNLYNFNVYRNDRSTLSSIHGRYGGVLIAVKKHLPSYELTTSKDIEQLFVMIGTGNDRKILGTVYIPPHSSVSVYNKFCNSIESFDEMYPNIPLFISGDINLPNILWFHNKFSSHSKPTPKAQTLEKDASNLLNESCSLLN